MSIRFQGITILHGGKTNPDLAAQRAEEVTSKKYEMSMVAVNPTKEEIYAVTREDMAALMKDTFNVTIEPDLYNASPADAKANPSLMKRIDECFKKIASEIDKTGVKAFMEKVAEYVETRQTKHNNKDAKGDTIVNEFVTPVGIIRKT